MTIKNTYAEYRHEAKWAFVPAEKGRWIRTHTSALHVNCPTCKQAAGHPCINITREDRAYQVPVHTERKALYLGMKRKDLLISVDETGQVRRQRA